MINGSREEDMADAALGRAYGRPVGTWDEELVRVGPGTPAGELFRRYWLPVAVSDELGQRPRRVRALGEDLIAFRDGRGRPGLLTERCMHRGTSLYYGRSEDAGIRCCHHGWLFDTQGHCLDQPCEVVSKGGLRRFRQPWYPVAERYGLVFAYLGPADEQPLLQRYDLLEEENRGYSIYVDAAEPHRTTTTVPNPAPYNWLQMSESGMDAAHVFVLHGNMGGAKHGDVPMSQPAIEWELTRAGMQYSARRSVPGGPDRLRIYENFLPCVHVGGNPVLTDLGRSAIISWHVPVDDTTVKQFSIMRLPTADVEALRDGSWAATMMGTPWKDRTEEERQDAPGDYEAQHGQGPITLHSEEHLVGSDEGVTMFRQLLRENIATVREGGRPINLHYSPDDCTVTVRSGNYIVDGG